MKGNKIKVWTLSNTTKDLEAPSIGRSYITVHSAVVNSKAIKPIDPRSIWSRCCGWSPSILRHHITKTTAIEIPQVITASWVPKLFSSQEGLPKLESRSFCIGIPRKKITKTKTIHYDYIVANIGEDRELKMSFFTSPDSSTASQITTTKLFEESPSRAVMGASRTGNALISLVRARSSEMASPLQIYTEDGESYNSTDGESKQTEVHSLHVSTATQRPIFHASPVIVSRAHLIPSSFVVTLDDLSSDTIIALLRDNPTQSQPFCLPCEKYETMAWFRNNPTVAEHSDGEIKARFDEFWTKINPVVSGLLVGTSEREAFTQGDIQFNIILNIFQQEFLKYKLNDKQFGTLIEYALDIIDPTMDFAQGNSTEHIYIPAGTATSRGHIAPIDNYIRFDRAATTPSNIEVAKRLKSAAKELYSGIMEALPTIRFRTTESGCDTASSSETPHTHVQRLSAPAGSMQTAYL